MICRAHPQPLHQLYFVRPFLFDVGVHNVPVGIRMSEFRNQDFGVQFARNLRLPLHAAVIVWKNLQYDLVAAEIHL